MPRFALLALAAFLISATTGAAQNQAAPPPVSVQTFTRNPAIWSAVLSPNGQYIAAVQETSRGEELIIIDWRTGEARSTQLARRDLSLHIDWVAWKNDDRLVFVLRQRVNNRSGGENYPFDTTRVFAANRDGGNPTLMFQGEMGDRVRGTYTPVQLIDVLDNDPRHVLLGAYAQHGFTIYRTDINTGHVDEIIDYADFDTVGMYVDGEGNPVLRVDALTDGSGLRYYRRTAHSREWQVAYEFRRAAVAQNHDFEPLGAGPGRNQIYVAARPENREFQAIYLMDTSTGELGAPVFEDAHADAAVAWLDANNNAILVGCGEIQRWSCRAVRPEMQHHLDALQNFFGADTDIGLHGVSKDETTWLVMAGSPARPLAYYVYELASAHVTPVASTEPQIPDGLLRPMSVINYSGRDGAPLWGYLTEPAGEGPHPLVVFPHGGPETRDSYGYDFFVQYLAWRGYSVFQPNFRGSEGSGRSFAMAGRRQWGRRMQDDITDGVRHLIETGAVDPARICIVGASYGGYAALAGVTLTPDLYQCAISISGVSDLPDILASERFHNGRNSAGYGYWVSLIGDPDVEGDALAAVSPARLAANVRVPVLLIHGDDDHVVPFEQSTTMQRALRRAGKSVELIRLENEGHIWSDWTRADRQRLLESVDGFLAPRLSPTPSPD